MLTIETPDVSQVNNSLAAMKKAGSGYVKARDIENSTAQRASFSVAHRSSPSNGDGYHQPPWINEENDVLV